MKEAERNDYMDQRRLWRRQIHTGRSGAKDNIGSAKTILRNGGIYVKDAADEDGETVEIYHIPV